VTAWSNAIEDYTDEGGVVSGVPTSRVGERQDQCPICHRRVPDDLDPTERDEALLAKGYADQSGEDYDIDIYDDPNDLWDDPAMDPEDWL